MCIIYVQVPLPLAGGVEEEYHCRFVSLDTGCLALEFSILDVSLNFVVSNSWAGKCGPTKFHVFVGEN